MTCKRCEDIHSAQKDGKTQIECKCYCHNTTTATSPNILWNGFGSGATLTDCTANTGTVTTMDFTATNSCGHTNVDICSCSNCGYDDCNCIEHKTIRDHHDSSCKIQRINMDDTKCRCKF